MLEAEDTFVRRYLVSRALTEVAQLAGDFNSGANYVASGLPKFTTLEEAAHGGQRELTLTDPASGQHKTLSVRLPPGVRPGQRIRLAGHRHRKTLKKLLQEADVPPWRRSRVPLLYFDGQLAAVAQIGVAAEFAASN